LPETVGCGPASSTRGLTSWPLVGVGLVPGVQPGPWLPRGDPVGPTRVGWLEWRTKLVGQERQRVYGATKVAACPAFESLPTECPCVPRRLATGRGPERGMFRRGKTR